MAMVMTLRPITADMARSKYFEVTILWITKRALL